ncbi:hypothetical protein C2E23DRAFT_740822 [Lenzites betulinus]|nr:hypothetical protein C2E23DRAFT_740822 [Lenzites betulinus]
MGYYVPVESLKIREYAFDRPTLLVMRLYYLRQMHILTELGKPEVFNDDDPLIRPILHEPAKFRGLGWAVERGTVGGWASVGRAEPRYITHFAGRPTLLFAAERALLSKLSKRAILTIDEMDL